MVYGFPEPPNEKRFFMQIFEPFKAAYLNRFREMKIFYLVTQTYEAAGEEAGEGRTPILISDYPDLSYAEVHYNAIRKDPYAAIINLENEKHLAKLQSMTAADSAYVLYWAAIKDAAALKRKISITYKEKIRGYISRKTDWRIAGGKELKADIQLIFGEVFFVVRKGNEMLRIGLKEIG